MPQQIQPQDTYADINFPLQGVDLSLGFGGQRPGTTREAVNVRSCEPLSQSDRGGARPGLVRYIDGTAGGVHLIQHLNYVVDPQAVATPWYDPPVPNPAEPTGPGIAGGINHSAPASAEGFGPVFGTYLDGDGNVIRWGGTGIRYRKTRKPRPTASINFVQGASNTNNPSVMTMSAAVGANRLLVLISAQKGGAADTVSIADTRGNVWSQAGSYSRIESAITPGLFLSVSMWYCITAAGAETATVTFSNGAATCSLGTLLEFSGVNVGAPLDATDDSAQQTPASSAVPVGTISADSGDMVIAAGLNMQDNNASGGSAVSFGAFATDVFGNVAWNNNVTGATGVTGMADTIGPPWNSYASVAASFNKA